VDLDQLTTWLRQQIAECEPTDDMQAPDVAERLPKLMRARRDAPRGYAFGFTFPDTVKDQIPASILPALDTAIEHWGTWLADKRGDAGKAFFEKAKRTYLLDDGEAPASE
jgi:hypothetical protein